MISVDTLQELQAVESDCTIQLTSDIDFSNQSGSIFNVFTGILDGNGYTVHNVSSSIIEQLKGGKIKNIYLKDCVTIASTSPYGVLCEKGHGHISNVHLEDCTITVEQNRANKVGGLVGKFEKGLIKNCSFTGKVTSKGHDIAGLVGDSSCIDYANEESNVPSDTTDQIHILNCSVDVVLDGGSSVGGIVGRSVNTYVFDCKAEGRVSGGEYTGGIAGHSTRNTDQQKTGIKNCQNCAYIESKGPAGGIVGLSRVELCRNKNKAEVVGESTVGGICGIIEKDTIYNCINTESVTGEEFVGGISGRTTSKIRKCINKSDISGSESVGGIVGLTGREYKKNTITVIQDCFSKGSVSGSKSGGLIGVAYRTKLTNVYSILTTVPTKKSDPICSEFDGTCTEAYWDSDVFESSNIGTQKSLTETDIRNVLLQL